MHPYVAQQPDELTLELADILNILDKTEDGEAGRGHCAHARPPGPCTGAPHQPEEEAGQLRPRRKQPAEPDARLWDPGPSTPPLP